MSNFLDETAASCFIGVDVGTGSARAGVFSSSGKTLATASKKINIFRPHGKPDYYQQSSEDIWQAVCESVQKAIAEANVAPENVRGIGFDATCSLVVLGDEDHPLSVSPESDSQTEFCENVIMWLDHRATAEAEEINATGHPALRCVGGTISPEHEVPKLLWLKRRLPAAFEGAAKLLDLGDFLAYRATGGRDVRSVCTTGCKWALDTTSDPGRPRWDPSFWEAVGLAPLPEAKVGADLRDVGAAVEGGVGRRAAEELGLAPGTAVGVGLIDAHAGGLGCLAAAFAAHRGSEDPEEARRAVEESMVLIAGTSTCHMISSRECLFVEGVWGPFRSAVVPGFYLQEGGQSVTGALLDHLIDGHPAAPEARRRAEEGGQLVYGALHDELRRMAAARGLDPEAEVGRLTADLHLTPDFAGNRGPVADPHLRGSMVGLSLSATIQDLALLYLSGLQAICYGTRMILDAAKKFGHPGWNQIYVCGGLSKQPLFLREQADSLGIPLAMPRETEAVLLGSAIAGASASGCFASVFEAMAAMGGAAGTVTPRPALRPYHDRKYAVFRRMVEDQLAYRALMASGGGEAENKAAKSGTLNIDFKNDQSFEGMYELQRELGSGSFSTVREGIHKQTNERFAVKVIKRMNLSREDEEALAEEVTILHGINHPNIIKVFDFFEEKDFYYLVTELMQGGELFDRIVKKTFYNEKEARDLVKILLSIVKHCHENDIVHRDLKPENLLMTSADDDTSFALADFGFAKLLRGNTLTEQCGTPGYVAPEILNGVPYGKPVDMWSFGVILYILLGGYAPFSENNQSKLFAKIKSGAYEFHPDFWGNVSSDAKDLIARMLQVDVAKRITVEAAYNHPWVQADADVLAERALDGNLEELRRFNARRKFKAEGKAIVAANRLASMIQQAK